MEAEDKYRYKEINPFKYNSKEAYKRDNTDVEFWVIIAFLIVVMCISAIFILVAFILPKNNSLALISVAILTFLFFALFIFVAWLSLESYGVGNFIDECKVRYKLWKYPNYFPIESRAITELNSIVKMPSGELFRKYQFINAEQSGTNYITLELPKNTLPTTSSSEKMCMFNRLSEMELMDILIPIKQYYEDKQYREEMERKETEIKAQSEANSRITTEDIHNLPLFKSMQSLADKTEEDVKKYHKETQSHLKDNQDIVDKVNETIKDKK